MDAASASGFDNITEFVTQWFAPHLAVQKGLAELWLSFEADLRSCRARNGSPNSFAFMFMHGTCIQC